VQVYNIAQIIIGHKQHQ